MTIGVGFCCDDSIVLCSDTQITVADYSKFYDTKISTYFGEHQVPFAKHTLASWKQQKKRPPAELPVVRDWAAVFTYSGSPDLWRRFDGDFKQAIALNDKPVTVTRLRDCIEQVLSLMEDQIAKDACDFYMLCALAEAPSDLLMLETTNAKVSYAPEVKHIGMGDVSMVRFLSHTLCRPTAPYTSFTTEQAVRLGIYLVYQAKEHVEGCGGYTEVIVLRAHAHWDVRNGETKDIEESIREVEQRLNTTAALCFDSRVSNEQLQQNWIATLKAIKANR